MDPTFSIELAPGVYMDSAGNITDTPVPNKPLYQPKAGFPVDADAIKRAAEGVAKMLPGTENGKPNKVSSFLSNIGVSADLIGVLGKIADIASVVGTVVPILGFALAVIKFAGLLDNGDDPLKTYISQRFDELEARAKADELKQELDKAAAVLNQFETALTKVEHYANHSTLSSITAATLANDQQSVSQQLDGLFSALGGLLTDLWQFVLTPADYGTTFWVQNNLFCIPDSGVPAPAFIPNTTELVFDYRPQLPLLAFGIQCYLTALKAGLPEYRTVGSSADILRKLALQIDDKLSSMRANCLARTIYKEGDGFLCDPPVVDPSLPLRLKFPGMVVGAWDLREYTDEYLNSVALHDATDHRATLQFKWMPPVGTPPGSYNPPTGKWILSQEEADAANQQSAQDYANLLISSGYMNLLHLSMTLRALSTETDSSETVEGGSYSYRRPQTGIPVTVETDVILSPAGSDDRHPRRTRLGGRCLPDSPTDRSRHPDYLSDLSSDVSNQHLLARRPAL